MIVLEQVKKNYQNFTLDCSLTVPEGCVTGLVGRNGAGKSTTFKAVLGLIGIDGGSARVFGKTAAELTKADREQMGVVLSNAGFSEYLKVKDLAPVLRNMYHSFDEAGFFEKCGRLRIPLDKQMKDFSTGMKAKFKLLLAMSYGARLLILDEPTAGLDAVVRNDLLDEMRKYMQQDGRAILISSHISSDLEGLCDDLYFIQNGKVLFHEDTDVILSDYAVLKVNEEQRRLMDKNYIIYEMKESFGYKLLTKEKQFYLDNYPGIVAEKGNIDEIMLIITKGEKL